MNDKHTFDEAARDFLKKAYDAASKETGIRVIQSTIPFQPTTLEEVEATLRLHYPDVLPEYKERREAKTGILRITLRTWTNATHHFQVRDIIGHTLESREIPL